MREEGRYCSKKKPFMHLYSYTGNYQIMEGTLYCTEWYTATLL